MIPVEIVDMAAEATSPHNDGWAQKASREQLRAKLGEYREAVVQSQEVVDYIVGILGDKVDGEGDEESQG